MISQNGKKIIERFVSAAKNLLMQNVTEMLQQWYGIWADGHTIGVEQLPSQDTDIVHTARMLRDRLQHLMAALPDTDTDADKERQAVGQLVAEQAFTQLNRFCALRMCEERDLIMESIRGGYESAGFMAYDSIAQSVGASRYERYRCYLLSVFDELSIELPAVFDRFSPFGLLFPDESTLMKLLELINDSQLSAWFDEQNAVTVNFWKEDETLGWMFQDYNSLEERRKMREASNKPRNSREMAVRNQFFTPEYVVRFLTDNSLGRIWYEMTRGESRIGEEQCRYMIRRPGEPLEERKLKEPTEILSLDPTCGSMHFGLYLYEVYEYIYMDAWDNQPSLLQEFREVHTRETFHREVPRLILENNIYGCEIDPRALQIAALSLWLRAQKSYSQMELDAAERPLITRSNLVLAEAMPGNKRLLKGLMDEFDKPMQRLLTTIWNKMKYVGEAGLLFKMEKEISDDIEYLRKNWSKVNQNRNANIFDSEERRAEIAAANEARTELRHHKDEFFEEIAERLQTALQELSSRLSEEEGYENALFSEDATRGFAFIELCQKRFDCIVMNPPFGEGSEHTSQYMNDNYPAWSKNLVCAFFDRMQEMLDDEGKLGAIFDRTVMIKSSYEAFRRRNLCGFITACADTGWGVLDASVETSTLVLNKLSSDVEGVFMNVQNVNPEEKNENLQVLIRTYNRGEDAKWIYVAKSIDFTNLPNTTIGYYFEENTLYLFKYPKFFERGFDSKKGHDLSANIYPRLFYEVIETDDFSLMYNGGGFTLFYFPYRDATKFVEDIIRSDSGCNIRSLHLQRQGMIGFGKRGDILDAHILKKGMIFTREGIGLPNISVTEGYATLSYLNSIISQYAINQYCGQHKGNGYVNLLPMPDYATCQSDIERIVKAIIAIKRKWFSLDETNLEYHGLIAQMHIDTTIDAALNKMQEQLTADYTRYEELVKENDDLWMDLADIDRGCEFRQTLNNYKARRPYEELLSIDGASNQNLIDKKTMAQEIVMELVGMAFGRWNTAYAKGEQAIPEFGDVFDALPFMPVVSQGETACPAQLDIPTDGILTNNSDSSFCLASHVREVMHYLWADRADDMEYELCQLIGCKSLQAYLASPTGFFDYHFKRYTKSRRKAPIYWLLASEDGTVDYWVYYPKLSKNTLPQLIIRLREQQEQLRTRLNAALAAHDKTQESQIRAEQEQVEGMMDELNRILAAGYVPNHDDGVPVTAAPLLHLAASRPWRVECEKNMELLEKGDYDWSHLAMSMYPARVTQKAKKDWCMALTHGLEHICENKPKEKKARKKKGDNINPQLSLSF
ncbi:BREX-1 system adenine-specific DNA-methyltransferase PglX [Segatella copri]|uniref:BREX-1 system adenine-specific DNA-methyltransferase PglX n=1 Tax=Segatella copri TaxID=165179 RepID=UPI00294B6CCB|nr:BREX-1 system adenine-specific DNA-methyltransferase PglX [Segatella copri]WOG04077.1 BREX-1 system adenine-specific DNA-methyltransferase PglX [Segatella copri]